MPETLPSSILNPTLSDDSNFALQLDTKNRFSSNDFQNPMGYPIPKIPQASLMDNKVVDGTLGESLFSSDRKVANFANMTIQQNLANTPSSIGVGVPQQFPYDKSMDKYLNESAGYNPYVSPAENEDYYYKNQYLQKSVFGKTLSNLGKGIARVAFGVAAKATQTLGFVGSLAWNGVAALVGEETGNEAMVNIADNSLSRWATSQEEDFKNSRLYSIYKPKDWGDKGFFSKLTYPEYWSDEIADGAAFMGEMMLTSWIGGEALDAIKPISKFGQLGINTASKLGKWAKYGIDTPLKFITGAENIGGIGRWAYLTTSEAAMEASQGYTDFKKKMQDGRNAGDPQYANMTDDEIDKKAGDAAASRFKMNLAILSFSNAFENKFIFEPILGKAKIANPLSKTIDIDKNTAEATVRKYSESPWVNKNIDLRNPNARLRFYGTRALEALGAEGFWEENAQLAIERQSVTDDYQNAGFWGKLGIFSKQLIKQTGQALSGNDPEAAENIGLGGVIGVLGTGFGAKAKNERQGEINKTTAVVENYEDKRRKFLSFNNIYDKDEEGNLVVNENKALAAMQGISDMTDKQEALSQLSDPLIKQHYQNMALGEFVFAAKDAGIFDRTINYFENLDKIDPEQLKELGFDPNTTISQKDIIDAAKEFGKIYEEENNRNVTTPEKSRTVTEQEIYENDQNRKYNAYRARVTAYSASKSAEQYLQKHLDDIVRPSVFSPDVAGVTSDVQEYNSLIYQKQSLRKFSQVSADNTGFYETHIENQNKKIDERIAEIKEGLQSKFDDGSIKSQPNGLLYTPTAYEDMTPEVRKTQLDLDNISQQKHAQLTNVVSTNNYLAQQITNPKTGYDNYIKYGEYLKSINQKDNSVTEDSHKVRKNDDGSYTIVSPDGKEISSEAKTDTEAAAQALKLDEEIPKPTPTPVVTKTPTKTTAKEKEVDTIVDDDKVDKYIPNEVSATKAVSWEFPTFTSKNDTINISGDTEQITSNDYDLMRADFINKFVDDIFNDKFKLFIVKDTFPQIYEGVKTKNGVDIVSKNEAGEFSFTDPNFQGEVVIIENNDGSRPTVGDFFGEKYPVLKDHPVIFSFDQGLDNGMFIREPLYSIRAGIKADKYESSIQEAKDSYEEEMRISQKARQFVRDNLGAKVSVAIAGYTNGINPKTTGDSIQNRFGEFSFQIAIPVAKGGTETQFGKTYLPGMVVATIGKFNFPVNTLSISNYPDILQKIQDTLAYKFTDRVKAETVVNQFLNVLVNTNPDVQYFRVDVAYEGFTISFRKKGDIIADDQIGEAKLNVSNTGLKEGYSDFNPPTGAVETVNASDYNAFIKPKLMTRLKKILDREGNITFEPVNPYFSFVVDDSIIPETGVKTTQQVQNENFTKFKDRINQLKSSNTLDVQKVSNTLTGELTRNTITQEQHDELQKLVNPTNSKNTQEDYDKGLLEAKKADIERRRQKTLKRAEEMWAENKDEKGFPRESLHPIQKRINTEYDAELAALEGNKEEPKKDYKAKIDEISKTEEAPKAITNLTPNKEGVYEPSTPESIKDKYKNQKPEDLSNIMGEKNTGIYTVTLNNVMYIYSPADNKVYTNKNGNLEEYTFPSSLFGKVIGSLEQSNPFKESEQGNSGFNKIDVQDTEGKFFTVYAPPTTVSNSEIIVHSNGVRVYPEENRSARDILKASLDIENKQKLQDFLDRYC